MRSTGMGLYAKLAVRNLFRNRRRTLITLGAMSFGAAAIILFGGFVNSIYVGVRESTIRSQIGHIQLYRKGYSEKGNLAPFDYLIRDYATLRAELVKMEHVRTVTARLGFSGLVSTGDTTTSFVGIGVDPEGEANLSSLAVMVDGQDLSSRDPRGVILGIGLARAFGVRPGDDLTLLTTTKGGSINALAVKVRGIWESGEKAYDDRFLKTPILEVQRLLDVDGDEVQSIVLLLDRTENTAIVRDRLAELIRERGLDLEMKTWEDLALRYHQVRELFGRIFAVLTLIVSVMVVFGITNTMTMAIFERTREIGTLMALGTRRRGVISMFVLEGLALGALGGLLGVILGVVLAKLVSALGIQLPPPPGSTRGFAVQILVVPFVLMQAFRLSIVTATLASLYPAWRAARLNVVEALRHV
jgi:putative ABC transport system permease protein